MTAPDDPRLIVFDCDGTLVDSAHIIVATLSASWHAEGLEPPSPVAIRHQIGLPLAQVIENLHPEGDRASWARLVQGYKDVFVSGRDIGSHEEPLYEGCARILERLSAYPNHFLGVATGKGRRGLDHTLQRHGIGRHFSVLKTADDGPGKPNPDILLDAMSEMGVSPWQTVVIGDTIFDVGMAVRAGARAIGVAWGYHPPDRLRQAGAAAIADRYDDLPDLIGNLWSVGRCGDS